MSKLIIIRGPSGAGKSTVSKMLHERALNKTALVEQDYFRHRMFNNPHDDIEATRFVMVAAVTAAISNGYDVIMDGILSVRKHQHYFDKLFQMHPDDNHFFYLDVPFDETVRRHATRAKSAHFGPDEMLEWYDRATVKYPGEHTLPPHLTAEQTCQQIVQIAGLAVKHS